MPRRAKPIETDPWHAQLRNLAQNINPAAARRVLAPGTANAAETLSRYSLPGSAQHAPRRLPRDLPPEFLPLI